MAKSINQIQKEAISEGFLSRYDKNRQDFLTEGNAPSTEYLIAQAASNFILKAIENLKKTGRTDTGALETDLSAGEIIKVGNFSYEVSLGYPSNSPTAKYYTFVDKGVKGVVNKSKAPNSPYSFRKLSVPPVMLNAIYGWAKRQGLSARADDQRRNLSALQVKRAGIRQATQKDPLFDVAYNIARAIKRSGLETTDYFSGAVEDFFGKEFVQAAAKTIAADIRVYIRQVQRG